MLKTILFAVGLFSVSAVSVAKLEQSSTMPAAVDASGLAVKSACGGYVKPATCASHRGCCWNGSCVKCD